MTRVSLKAAKFISLAEQHSETFSVGYISFKSEAVMVTQKKYCKTDKRAQQQLKKIYESFGILVSSTDEFWH